MVLSLTEDSDKREEMLAKFQDFQRKADMYYAYHSIQRYTVSVALGKMSELKSECDEKNSHCPLRSFHYKIK